ncbi:MAG: class I SAM-dependent methyltransferase [Elusimicrobiota bacterium]|jgi:SAM-dependent methyltransferase
MAAPSSDFLKMYRAYGGIGRGSLFFCYRWLAFAHRLVSETIPPAGRIYDLGCGYGIFSNYLAMQRPERRLVAVDLSPVRIRSAERAARALGLRNISFAREDIFRIGLESAQAVIITDFLHHLPSRESQTLLLERICAAIQPGGKLIIVDVQNRPRWKYILGWLVDHTIYLGDKINYLAIPELIDFLAARGFQSRIVPIDAGRPYSNFLCVATKR